MKSVMRPLIFAAILMALALAMVLARTDAPVNAQTTCSGNQANNEQVNGSDLYIAKGQTLHVNMNLPGLSQQQLTDIQKGIQSWAGTSGMSIVFDSSAAGPGVITVGLDPKLPDVGFGGFHTAPNQPPNQVSSGKISFNFGFQMNCTTGTCFAYDPNAPNADNYLTGLAAHEMGHVLGLNDTTDAGECGGQTSTSVMGGACGTNNNGDGISPPTPTSTAPTSCDKQNVQQQTNLNTVTGGGKTGGPYVYDPGTGGGTGGGGGTGCYWYDDWNDATNTLTDYFICG